MRPVSAPEESYRSRASRFAGEEALLARRSAALSWARLAAAGAVVAFLFLGLLAAAAPPAWVWLAAAAGAAVFTALALAHDRVIRRQRRWGELAALKPLMPPEKLLMFASAADCPGSRATLSGATAASSAAPAAARPS